jgi:hypothetical protein
LQSALRKGEDCMVAATRTSTAWERYAWVAGIVFVVAIVAEIVVAFGVGVNQNDSAAKIVNALHEHRTGLKVIAYLSVVYAAMFLIYLNGLHVALRGQTDRARFLASLMLTGGCSRLPCTPLATSGSPAYSEPSSRRSALNTIRACPTPCT